MPKMEQRETPENYRHFPGGKELPATLPAWRVQTLKPQTNSGVVAGAYGFEDSPDAEIITPGMNFGKEPGAVGIGRHGNFLQWGFAGSPDEMTEPARNLFLNCICYIKKYDRMGPLVTWKSSPRMNALRVAGLIDTNFQNGNAWVLNSFQPGLAARYKGRAEQFVALFKKDLELVYHEEGKYLVDEDLKAMGIPSNRRIETLDKLIGLLERPETAAAARKVLDRYTEQSGLSPVALRKWVNDNRERIYFSDLGGYKFRVMPEGYLPRPGWKSE
jgi:hypothetical protein